MELEKSLVKYVSDSRFEDIPNEPVDTIKNVILTILGTTIAGATAEGCDALIDQVKKWGGEEEATILIYGDKVPAYNAAFVNSTMARALDFCDAMHHGIHIGSSSVPTALAAAELAGGCTGKDFLAALILGTEIAARLNLSSNYDGFDPTGVCSIFASTAIAGKILHLETAQMMNALALAFNKSGGSFQSNIDGSLAVRLIQGFVSQGGIMCAQLAQIGLTGPKNFLEGIYGYFHLYAKGRYDPQMVTGDLGEKFEMTRTIFKRYPSCGGTLASTDAILDLVQEKNISPEDIARIDIKVTPAIYNLVGHQFEIGDYPRVNAQFNIQYCIANALLRKSSRLHHFEESFVRDPKIMELTKKIHVSADPALDRRSRTALDMRLKIRQGTIHNKSLDIPHGFPGDILTDEEHKERFKDCLNYAGKPLPRENIDKIISSVNKLEQLEDVRVLIPLLLSHN